MEETINLSGSDNQIVWAMSIINKLNTRYPHVTLPQVASAAWWIQNRHLSVSELLEKAEKLSNNPNYASSGFSSSYPRHSRQDSLQALKSLSWDRVAVLDTETSGMSKGSEVIELSIVRYLSSTRKTEH